VVLGSGGIGAFENEDGDVPSLEKLRAHCSPMQSFGVAMRAVGGSISRDRSHGYRVCRMFILSRIHTHTSVAPLYTHTGLGEHIG
jgi:hypothetical protein